MERLFLVFIGLCFSVCVRAQTYEFINEVFKSSNQDTILLMDKFVVFSEEGINTRFNKSNIENLWAPLIYSDEVPSIEVFFNNFNLNHLRVNLISNRDDTKIDFSHLDDTFISVTENDLKEIQEKWKNNSKFEENKRYLNKLYLKVSNPIFNCSKDWVVVITESFSPFLDIGTSGYMNIYRKLKGKWVLYNRLELWIS